MPNIDLLLNVGSVVHFSKNQVVFEENDAGVNMYIALKGVFGVYATSCTGFPLRVAEIKPGSFFGEMSAIDDWPRSATIMSEEIGAALVIEKDKLRTMFEKSPDIADSIIIMLKTRVNKTARIVRQSGKNIPALPELPQDMDTIDDKMAAMAALSRQIRLVNKLLLNKNAVIGEVCEQESSSLARLLPKGYKPINRTDSNDNEDTLQFETLYCPYCNMEQEVYIPSKSNIPQKNTCRTVE